MIFFPSEAFILGLFIVAAIFIFNYGKYIISIIGINSAYAADMFKRQANKQKYLAIIFLTLAISCGFSSSLMPILE
ncbi:hypothetical protein NVD72_004415 [Salmonella enterica]|uniref:A1 protein n=18 Tax=Epseptimavirus TaxID=2732017 RepID=A0A0A0RTN8_9CAUD|nr:membrane protein [Salmonella phage Stitch]YP_009146111.1 membrane protein [Salmonella phage Stitch]YP_009320734.1 membrane protein [Salmonella phage 100268_sal2]YP_009320903.1 membrane protein [Salmonella phage 100268_sal2]YP_009323735.1 membrane protein [Salmonella phage 118970_sal2]YP_009804122.1 membrane protein [Salmonella phage SH9]YP_009805720.1 membrane protein [Salmonella phage S132]YP_009815123.1 membrane protein [Salmonella phage STG2]YP_009845202.1 membrane protein [Salmonella